MEQEIFNDVLKKVLGEKGERSLDAPIWETRDGGAGKFYQLLFGAVDPSIPKKVVSIMLPKMERSCVNHLL
ncbi:hypothetical protein SESBI_21162 [Sesbania bispinosa]|nr:hypothetical protein SESBI_21162 [Sesbania bispinosa]